MCVMAEFDERLWGAMVDYVTVGVDKRHDGSVPGWDGDGDVITGVAIKILGLAGISKLLSKENHLLVFSMKEFWVHGIVESVNVLRR